MYYFKYATHLFLFLGVGKSMLILLMSQWAEEILMKVGDDPLKPRVMLMAFSGKAAALIGKCIQIIHLHN